MHREAPAVAAYRRRPGILRAPVLDRTSALKIASEGWLSLLGIVKRADRGKPTDRTEIGNGEFWQPKAMCRHGELVHRRKTTEAALRKAREMSENGCYDICIITPEGRD